MKTRTILLAVVILSSLFSSAYALYTVADRGTWPDSWPAELDPLREQSRTFVGPLAPQPHYEIPFRNREEFEAAWPHILKVKSKGAPLFLVHPPARLGGTKAGVWIHSPPPQRQPQPEEPLPGDRRERSRWTYTTWIELVVDGQIVDLNRIPLPADSPIVDERFQK